MKTTIQLLFFILFTTFLFAQEQEVVRVPVEGIITAPVGEPIEGIHIYNISSQKGVVTDENGFFKMNMAKNDRLEVTALQFLSFKVIVDEGIIENNQVKIYMNPAVNELAEVIIRPYDLFGNIAVDVGKIKTYNINEGWDLSYEELEFGYEFAPDAVTSIPGNLAENVYYNGQNQIGANFLGGLGLLGQLFFGKPKAKQSKVQNKVSNEQLYYSFRGRFTNEVLMSQFGIPQKEAAQFVYFLEDKGIPRNLMKLENELLLLEYMRTESALFLKQIEKQ